jgi:hypothetical protein
MNVAASDVSTHRENIALLVLLVLQNEQTKQCGISWSGIDKIKLFPWLSEFSRSGRHLNDKTGQINFQFIQGFSYTPLVAFKRLYGQKLSGRSHEMVALPSGSNERCWQSSCLHKGFTELLVAPATTHNNNDTFRKVALSTPTR